MDKNRTIIIIGVALALLIMVAAVLVTTHNVVYDSSGEVKAKSSDLTFKYKNEESIYAAFNSDYTVDHTLYYDEAKIKGTVKLDLNDVKWDESYVPYNDTNDEGKEIEHVNDVAYAEENFINLITEDYENNNLNTSIDVYLQDDNGITARSSYSYGDELPDIISDFKLKDGVVTLKFNHNYHQNTVTKMFNAADYEGNLLDSRNDDHKISQAVIDIHFFNDNYDFKVESVLKGDDFVHKHM